MSSTSHSQITSQYTQTGYIILTREMERVSRTPIQHIADEDRAVITHRNIEVNVKSLQEKANTPDKNSSLVAPMGLELAYHAPLKEDVLSPVNGLRSIAAPLLVTDDRTDSDSIENGTVSESDSTEYRIIDPTELNPGVSNTYDHCYDTLNTSKDVYYYRELLKKKLNKAGLLNEFGSSVYKDCGNIIEVCTPVHKTWESMKEWFVKADTIAKKNSFLSWKKKKGGGGMHINISYNKTIPNWELAYLNFFIMIASHPELNWIFSKCIC